MDPEMKTAIDKFMKDWADFQVINEKRLVAIESGKGIAEFETQLAAVNASMDKMAGFNALLTAAQVEAKDLAERVASQDEKMEELETAMARDPRLGALLPDGVETPQAAFLEWCRAGPAALTDERKAILTISDDTGGGYLAPSEYVKEIIKAEIEFSPLRTIARIRSTGQRSAMIPKRTGTFAAVWVGEVSTRSETTGLAYGLEEVPTHELSALVDISQMDLEDSDFDLEAELNMEFAEQFGVAEGISFVTGDSVSKPEGFMTNPDVAETVSGNATLIRMDGMLDLYYGIKTAYAANATWVLNRTSLGAVRKLKDADGQYLWHPGLVVGQPNTLNGAPYVEMPDMDDEGADNFPVAFGNFRRAYIIIDRISMVVLRDPFTQATSGIIRFVARRRVGGQVVLAEAIRKLKCSN